MKTELIGLTVLMLVALLWCVYLVALANECGQAGGAFIIPQQGWPVCVAGVKP